MDFLDDNEVLELELPQTSELSIELFADSLEKYSQKKENGKVDFDIDQFLMDNNFQYTPLDTLIRTVSDLTDEALRNLLTEITKNYNSYIEFFKTYNKDDNEILLELQKTKADIDNFTGGLKQLLVKDIPKTQETITDMCEYLKGLDSISNTLKEHNVLAGKVSTGKKLSKTLHEMCGLDEIDETLSADLVQNINDHVTICSKLFAKFGELHSPFLSHLHNEYQGLVQEFQLSLKIIAERCLADVATYPNLARALVSLINNV